MASGYEQDDRDDIMLKSSSYNDNSISAEEIYDILGLGELDYEER